MPDLLNVKVIGTPAPQGSKRHVGNGVMVESSKKVAPWREAVTWVAHDALHGKLGTTGPVVVAIMFLLDRPKGHYGTGRNAGKLRNSAPTRPAVKPDIDKLIRSTLDALKTAGVYRDDSQVIRIMADKWYADGQPAGASILVKEVSA